MARNMVHKLESAIFRIYSPFTFLTLNEVDYYIYLLKGKIEQAQYPPDVIVGIGRDGVYPGIKLADYFKADFAQLRINHYAINFGNFEIDDIVGAYRLARLLGHSPQVSVIEDFVMPIENKRILIVDDDSSSGMTLQKAISHVGLKLPAEIKTAALVTHSANPFVDYAGLCLEKEDFRRLKYRMPWAKFNPDYVDISNSENMNPLETICLK